MKRQATQATCLILTSSGSPMGSSSSTPWTNQTCNWAVELSGLRPLPTLTLTGSAFTARCHMSRPRSYYRMFLIDESIVRVTVAWGLLGLMDPGKWFQVHLTNKRGGLSRQDRAFSKEPCGDDSQTCYDWMCSITDSTYCGTLHTDLATIATTVLWYKADSPTMTNSTPQSKHMHSRAWANTVCF